MSGVLSLMVAGGGGGGVDVVGGNVTHIALSPANASATYYLNLSGSESSDPSAISNTWLLSGAAVDYDVRATVTAGSVSSGSATGSWLNMGTSRSWSAVRTLDAAGIATASLTIEVRNAATLALLDTATVVLTAEVAI